MTEQFKYHVDRLKYRMEDISDDLNEYPEDYEIENAFISLQEKYEEFINVLKNHGYIEK